MLLAAAFQGAGASVVSCLHAFANVRGLREKLFIDFKSGD